jgi:hypothetical protein
MLCVILLSVVFFTAMLNAVVLGFIMLRVAFFVVLNVSILGTILLSIGMLITVVP